MKLFVIVIQVVAGFIFSIALAACSATVSSNTDATSLTYDMTCNGQPTGSHSFSSKASYCNGLLDDSLNNFACGQMRADTYRTSCQGVSLTDTETVAADEVPAESI